MLGWKKLLIRWKDHKNGSVPLELINQNGTNGKSTTVIYVYTNKSSTNLLIMVLIIKALSVYRNGITVPMIPLPLKLNA